MRWKYADWPFLAEQYYHEAERGAFLKTIWLKLQLDDHNKGRKLAYDVTEIFAASNTEIIKLRFGLF